MWINGTFPTGIWHLKNRLAAPAALEQSEAREAAVVDPHVAPTHAHNHCCGGVVELLAHSANAVAIVVWFLFPEARAHPPLWGPLIVSAAAHATVAEK